RRRRLPHRRRIPSRHARASTEGSAVKTTTAREKTPARALAQCAKQAVIFTSRRKNMPEPITCFAWLESYLASGPKSVSEIRDASRSRRFSWILVLHTAEMLCVKENGERWALDHEPVPCEPQSDEEKGFALYCLLGPRRSLDAVARRLGRST